MLKRNEDLSIGRTDRGVIAEGQAVLLRYNTEIIQYQADILQTNRVADAVLNSAEDLFGLLDSGACGRANMQPKLSGIDVGKKVTANPRQSDEGSAKHPKEKHKDGRALHPSPPN